MIITTTQPMVGSRSHTPCGVVVVEKVLALINSKKLNSEESSEKALQDIRAQAEALGADAVVDVEIKHKTIRGSAKVVVTVSGNAVKLR